MKIHADLHLKLQLENSEYRKEILEKSAELGYDIVGIPFMLNSSENEVKNIRQTCRDIGLDLVTRIDLAPKSPRTLLSKLRVVRKKVEVIAVQCYSKGVARQAAKDHRVDLISFPSVDPRKRFFDSAEAELASLALTSFEIDMAPLLYLQDFQRIRLLSFLRKEVSFAKKHSVPIVLSSGANQATLLRKPKDFIALTFLFNLDTQVAKQAISVNPQAIVERNRKKMNFEHITPGVRIIRRGMID